MNEVKLSNDVKVFVMSFATNRKKLSYYMDDEEIVENCREIHVHKKSGVKIPDDISMLSKLKTLKMAFCEIEKMPKLPDSLRYLDIAYCGLKKKPDVPKKCRVEKRGNDF